MQAQSYLFTSKLTESINNLLWWHKL